MTQLLVEPAKKPHQEFPYERKEMQSKPHQRLFSFFTAQLEELFSNDPDANVGGDQAFYWNPEDDRDCVCPDAYVVRGIDKTPRLSFKLWEERRNFPNLSIRFALEIWSKGNPMSERFKKYDAYRALGVWEYLEVDLLQNELCLHRKANGDYVTLEPNADGRIFSAELNAEIALEDGLLRLYRKGEKILTAQEARQKLSEAEQKLSEAEQRLSETEARLAEERAEKERLLKELEQLKSQRQ